MPLQFNAQINSSYLYPNNGDSDGYSYLPEKLQGDIVLTPIFDTNPIEYHIEYLGIDDTCVNNNPNSYSAIMTKDLVLTNPIREGYSFVGWILNNKLICIFIICICTNVIFTISNATF